MAETIIAPKKEKGHFRRNWAFYFLIMGLIGALAYGWFIKSSELQAEKTHHEDEVIAIEKMAQAALQTANERDMTSVARAFALATAGRAMFSDWEDLDSYFRQLVKADNILEVTLVEDDGLVMVSTNKKLEEEYWKDANLTTIQETEKVIFLKNDLGQDIVVAPVMNKESRYGTIVIVFKRDELKKVVM